jgi:hypothetical protein
MVVDGCNTGSFSGEALSERTCTVQWPGTTEIREVWIGIDRTPPQLVGLQPDRPPDFNGWFTRPVGLTFQGTDKTSGVASCSSTTFGGPDGLGLMVSGTCRDVAGNTGSGALPLNYDATPPASPAVTAVPGKRRVALRWAAEPGTEAEVARLGKRGGSAVVYRGDGGAFTDRKLRNGRRYRYLVTLIDQAGNRSADQASAVPTASRLLTPADGARLRRPPTLTWKAVRKARYYNAQLIRHGRKILSRWPRAARLELPRRWRFGGRRYRLVPGRYCWHVWPGLGARSERRYGRRLGSSCFRVVR